MKTTFDVFRAQIAHVNDIVQRTHALNDDAFDLIDASLFVARDVLLCDVDDDATLHDVLHANIAQLRSMSRHAMCDDVRDAFDAINTCVQS